MDLGWGSEARGFDEVWLGWERRGLCNCYWALGIFCRFGFSAGMRLDWGLSYRGTKERETVSVKALLKG